MSGIGERPVCLMSRSRSGSTVGARAVCCERKLGKKIGRKFAVSCARSSGFLLILALATTCGFRSFAATWIASPALPGSRISDILPQLALGDTIQLAEGTFSELLPYDFGGGNSGLAVLPLNVQVSMFGSGLDPTRIQATSKRVNSNCGIVLGPSSGGSSFADFTVSDFPIGILAVEAFQLQDVALERCQYSCMLFTYGELVGSRISFLDNRVGMRVSGPYTTAEITDCNFYGSYQRDIDAYDGAQISVANTTMRNTWIAIGAHGFGTHVTLENVVIEAEQRGIDTSFDTLMELKSCRVEVTGGVAIGLRGSYFQADNSYFSGYRGFEIGSARNAVRVNDCTILSNGLGSVYCYGIVADPPAIFDFRNNYWGTSNADSIASLIRDMHDDPTVLATVDFVPFRTAPIKSRALSFSEFRSLWGKGER